MSTTPDGDAVQHIIETAQEAVKPVRIDGERGQSLTFVVPNGSSVQTLDITEHLAKHQDRPARIRAARVAQTPEAFADYINRHAIADDTEVWADILKSRVTGIINSNGDAAGWGDHTISYGVAFTKAWVAWANYDGKWLDQTTFAEHIEDRAIDVRKPAAADMLEIAQNFKATNNVHFKSTKHLSTGQTELEYRENIDASATTKAGQLTIPEIIVLGLQPFEGAKSYAVNARFRFRINGGNLQMSYRLERPEDILRAAFKDVVDTIREAIEREGVAVYEGAPS